jgi:chemotaxis regulatin CheY-phosphate phosphatase CheZ
MSYDTGVYRVHQFSAYNNNFEPACQLAPFDHAYHKQGEDLGNTTNDLLLGIWDILKFQAKWLEEKLEYFKDNSLSQEDLNRQTEDLRNIVNRAGRVIEDQNNEILERFSGFKREIEKIFNEKNLDRKFEHTEKVIRDCLDDVEYRISKLQRMGRDILEEVRNSSGKTDVEKLVLENNRILRKLDEEKLATQSDIRNIRIPGLEQLVRREDLKDLERQIDPRTLVRRTDLKQENILQQLEENNRILKNFDVRELEQIIRKQTRELEEIRNEISRKIDRIPVDSSIERELEKAQEQLRKISQLIGADSRRY